MATSDWFTVLCLCGPAKLLGQFRYQANVDTVFYLISEHTLISEQPPFCAGEDYCQSTYRDLCVLAVLLCCIMQSIFDAN